jgi:SAM-dependent methyltransferase
MNESFIGLLRSGRTAAQLLAEPIDWTARMLNNKHNYPPLWRRQRVGSLYDFEGSNGEYLAYLKLMCGLKEGDTVLDLGCGYGTICFDTTGAGSILDVVGETGAYYGVDTHKPSINWCTKHIKINQYSNFRHIMDLSEMLYDNCRADVVLAKSVFTHIVPTSPRKLIPSMLTNDDTLCWTLRCLTAVTKPGCKLLTTWFLYNSRPRNGKLKFMYPYHHYFLERETKPDLAVAYDEEYLTLVLRELGFNIINTYYGTWTGHSGLSFQDILILERT